MEEESSQYTDQRKETEVNMNSKCYDCVYCSVDKKYRQTCTVLVTKYAWQMGVKQPCNFFKTYAQDEAIKRACAKRLVAKGMFANEEDYMKRNKRIPYEMPRDHREVDEDGVSAEV